MASARCGIFENDIRMVRLPLIDYVHYLLEQTNANVQQIPIGSTYELIGALWSDSFTAGDSSTTGECLKRTCSRFFLLDPSRLVLPEGISKHALWFDMIGSQASHGTTTLREFVGTLESIAAVSKSAVTDARLGVALVHGLSNDFTRTFAGMLNANPSVQHKFQALSQALIKFEEELPRRNAGTQRTAAPVAAIADATPPPPAQPPVVSAPTTSASIVQLDAAALVAALQSPARTNQPRPGRRPQQRQNQQQQYRDPRTCFKCGKQGHIAALCRSGRPPGNA